jgi:hypothetical protein
LILKNKPPINIGPDGSVSVDGGEQGTLTITSEGVHALTYADGKIDKMTKNVDGSIDFTLKDGLLINRNKGIDSATYLNGTVAKSYPYGNFVKYGRYGKMEEFYVGEIPWVFRENIFNFPETDKKEVTISSNSKVTFDYTGSKTLIIYSGETEPIIKINRTDKTMLMEYDSGIISMNYQGELVDTQNNGNVISITEDGIMSAVNSEGNPITSGYSTPAEYIEKVNERTKYNLPGEIMLEVTSYFWKFTMKDMIKKSFWFNKSYQENYPSRDDYVKVTDHYYFNEDYSDLVFKEMSDDVEKWYNEDGTIEIKHRVDNFTSNITFSGNETKIIESRGHTITVTPQMTKFVFSDNIEFQKTHPTDPNENIVMTFTDADGTETNMVVLSQNDNESNTSSSDP